MDAYLESVLIGGQEEQVVEIVNYQPSWVERFEHQRDRIRRTLGSAVREIEHVGSTSVPELAAKPIVDIMVTVDDPDDETKFAPQMEVLGYLLRVREPGHRMFRTVERDVHVHFWVAGSADAERHLVFRDWLRSHPEDRAEYERAKRDLAGRWQDMNYYAEAKTGIIQMIIERAQSPTV
jgi:GrpB-like predicted nucleotidyltransferase (UPF0157 family)